MCVRRLKIGNKYLSLVLPKQILFVNILITFTQDAYIE